MSLSKEFAVGGLRCYCLDAGSIRLDGGAMFGVVARPLWEKSHPPDEFNRIKLVMRCVLVEHPDGLMLIDTGVGNKENEKFRKIYGVRNAGKHGRTMLEDALSEVGASPSDVRWVINTHLHFDHAGGNTFIDEGLSVAFPKATYVVQAGELEAARSPHERSSASYLKDNHEPVTAAEAWQPVDGRVEILPGVSLIPTPGHTPYHQSVLLSGGSEVFLYAGDLFPTAEHIPLPWIMAYDLEPLRTLETKRGLLANAEREKWTVIFEHDPNVAFGRIVKDEKSYVCEPLDTPKGQT